MGLMSSLYSGASGIDANTQDLNVVGDNIANGNTVGFKASRANFADALSQSLLGGAGQVGQGVRLMTVQKIFTQGSLLNTGVATDLAIQGKGMLIVRGNHNGQEADFYTRAGQLTIDKDGYLVTAEGLRAQGYDADSAGAVSARVGDLRPGNQTSPPKATSKIEVTANLKADSPVIAEPWDPAKPGATSNFTTSTTVYDSLGAAHQVDIYFRKNADGAWEWHALTEGGGIDGGTSGQNTEIGAGTLTFDATGNIAEAGFTVTPGIEFRPKGATGPQPLTFDFGSRTQAGITQFPSDSVTSFMSLDGFPAGDLTSLQVDPEGKVIGIFTNGQSRTLGQVALADFPAEDQLQRVGSTLFARTFAAGEPATGKPTVGGFGAISSGSLEQSTVDISQEFIRMMTAQRGFQANSKTITTADQLLNELIQLKRG